MPFTLFRSLPLSQAPRHSCEDQSLFPSCRGWPLRLARRHGCPGLFRLVGDGQGVYLGQDRRCGGLQPEATTVGLQCRRRVLGGRSNGMRFVFARTKRERKE